MKKTICNLINGLAYSHKVTVLRNEAIKAGIVNSARGEILATVLTALLFAGLFVNFPAVALMGISVFFIQGVACFFVQFSAEEMARMQAHAIKQF